MKQRRLKRNRAARFINLSCDILDMFEYPGEEREEREEGESGREKNWCEKMWERVLNSHEQLIVNGFRMGYNAEQLAELTGRTPQHCARVLALAVLLLKELKKAGLEKRLDNLANAMLKTADSLEKPETHSFSSELFPSAEAAIRLARSRFFIPPRLSTALDVALVHTNEGKLEETDIEVYVTALRSTAGALLHRAGFRKTFLANLERTRLLISPKKEAVEELSIRFRD